jgi:acyl carrier protein
MKERILQFIADQTMRDDIKISDSLKDDLKMDSLDFVEFVIEVENEFGITIVDGEAETFKTVQDVIELIDRKVTG